MGILDDVNPFDIILPIGGVITIGSLCVALLLPLKTDKNAVADPTNIAYVTETALAEITPGAEITPDFVPSPTNTSEPTLAISSSNNPFDSGLEYDVRQSFNIVFKPIPVGNLEGTLISSNTGSMNIYYDEGFSSKPFEEMIVRAPTGETYYLIYPIERTIPAGTHISIGRYWAIRDEVTLMNNMLVYITERKDIYYPAYADLPIESSAHDGHFDGIIELGSIAYLEPEVNP